MIGTDNAAPSTRAASEGRDLRARLLQPRLPAFLGPLAMALGFILVVALAASTLWLIEQSRAGRQRVDHTHLVQNAIADIRTHLVDAESARRGFLLDPDPSLDTAYRESAGRLPADIEQLRTLTRDSAVQQANLAAFEQLYDVHDRSQTTSILGVRIGARDPALRTFREDGSMARIQHLEAALSRMSEREEMLLALRTAEESAATQLLFTTTVAGVALIALLGLLSIGAYARDAAALERSRDQLRRFNEELEHAVAQRTAELEQANAEVQRFAHLVSHDLRAPLVNIVGFTNELRHIRESLQLPPEKRPPAIDEDFAEAIQFIQISAEKMDRLVNSILRMAREGGRTLTPQDIDMTAMVATLFDGARRQAGERNVSLEIEGALPAIANDRLAVEQVFSNLIDNAVKYAKKDAPGHVRVRGRAVGDWVEFEVEDGGVGIAAKDQVRIFEMFRRAGNSSEPGEGVGLAYTRQIVRRLGGVIQVHSRLGEGAKFRVSLPRKLALQDSKPEI